MLLAGTDYNMLLAGTDASRGAEWNGFLREALNPGFLGNLLEFRNLPVMENDQRMETARQLLSETDDVKRTMCMSFGVYALHVWAVLLVENWPLLKAGAPVYLTEKQFLAAEAWLEALHAVQLHDAA